MKHLVLYVSLLLAMVVSGCIFDSDSDKKSDTTKKGSVSGTVKLTVTGESVAGVKVMLINRDVKGDSINIWDNMKAFVDSAITDSEGKYVINNIASGNYGVYPVNSDTLVSYKFTFSASPDSCAFEMNGESRSVNFIAEKLSVPAFYEDSIVDYVYFKNGKVSFATGARRMWIFFVPFPSDKLILYPVDEKSGEQWVYYPYQPGFTALVVTFDNYVFYEVTYDNGKKRSFTISHPLGAAANSKFYYDYDLSTGVLTERK